MVTHDFNVPLVQLQIYSLYIILALSSVLIYPNILNVYVFFF